MDGAADFDIIIEQTLGIPILLDAGARFSGSVGGTYVAGSNFLTQLIRSKMGWPLEDMQIRNNCVLRPLSLCVRFQLQMRVIFSNETLALLAFSVSPKCLRG